jgi:hypothetical protein
MLKLYYYMYNNPTNVGKTVNRKYLIKTYILYISWLNIDRFVRFKPLNILENHTDSENIV